MKHGLIVRYGFITGGDTTANIKITAVGESDSSLLDNIIADIDGFIMRNHFKEMVIEKDQTFNSYVYIRNLQLAVGVESLNYIRRALASV